MKHLLKKKLLGIPIVALLVMALMAGVVLAYVVQTVTKPSEVTEPITVSITDDLLTSLYPGESDDLILSINNGVATTYGMTYTLTITKPEGVTVTPYIDLDGDGTGVGYASYTSGTKATIPVAGTGAEHLLKVTVTSTKGAAPGAISVAVAVDRSAP